MRFLVDQRSYDHMLAKKSHPRDCYVRKEEYLHHVYLDGVKYTVARALYDCIKQAGEAGDQEAL
ncbi:MAG TPA: ATP-binding protein, partial [Roseiflexaceae bacterium]|nr:ATP-binding protein [Roseiflexaceae bacterium]